MVLCIGVTASVANLAGSSPASAQTPPGSLSIQKVADASTVEPGQAFNYTVQVQCSTAAGGGCVNATLTDPLPTFITLNGPITVTGAATPPIVDEGPPIVITFQDDLGDGTTGLVAGQIVTITVPVVVDPTIPVEQNGVPIDNTATIDADNADPKESTATVTPEVPVSISADTTKSFIPGSQIAGSTDPITLSLTGTSTSNVPVDTLVIQDPADPTAVPNPFDYLEVADVGTPTLPAGADTVTTEVFIDPDWVDAGTADLSQATGVRYTFTDTDGSGIDPGATGSVDVTLEQRDPSPEPIPADGLQIDNDVQTTVDLEGQDPATADATDSFNIRQSQLAVDATKSFDPNEVNAGEPSTVTLTGRNATPDAAPEPMTSMTVTESTGPTNPFTDGPHPITFNGFTDDFTWPGGADAATITYVCDGQPVQPTQDITPFGVPPEPVDPCTNADVIGFEITFDDTDGSGFVSNTAAIIPFDVITDDTQESPDTLPHFNQFDVSGTDGSTTNTASDSDTLTTIIDRLAVVTGKTVTPASIPGRPGQIAIVELTGEVLPFPDSTIDATEIIVQDPSALPDPNGWFAAFAPQSVTATPVPACSTLTVEYTIDDGGSWLPVPGLLGDGIDGPTIVNEPLPTDVTDNADGIRFVYTAAPAGGGCEGGFPPGTTVAPNLSFGVRPGGPADDPAVDPTTFQNCADTTADADTVDAVESAEACDTIDVTPPAVGPGDVDPIDKAWDLDLLNARSQEEAGATISWSTQGYTGLEAVRISDIPDPSTTPLPDSVYDTFDLVGIDAITPTMDPHLTYDQITSTELFVVTDPTDPSTGSWVQAPNDPCPAGCDGTYPGYTLDPNIDPETVLGFRLLYQESPTRADRLDAGAPPVGTGVAVSSGNDRQIHPVFELRDVMRSDNTIPVIAQNTYNTADPGVIRNDVMMEAVFDLEDTPFEWFDDDTIAIVDVPVTVNATKDWIGGPIGIPEVGVPQAEYPRTLVTLTGTNTTPAKIDQLVITDDTDGEMFEWFNVTEFASTDPSSDVITPPEDIGADTVVITLDRSGTSTDYTRAEALALTEADLDDVTGITVTYDGRINIDEPPGAATATIEFGVRLREFARSDGTTRPTTDVSPVDNQMTVDGADLVDIPSENIPNPDNWTASSTADADMQLIDQGIGVIASKTIVPPSQQEPDDSPVTVTIGGQPTGGGDPPTPPPSRAVEMVLIDDDPLLFNQYDFVGLDDITFAAPIDQVQVDALTGGTWGLDVDGNPTVTGATWQLGDPTTGPGLTLPAGVDPEDVQGLRFTFTRVDGANWENPTPTPNQLVSFQIQRRENLNVDADGNLDTTPVPVDLPDFNDPAPGETDAGTATNTSTAQATSSDTDTNGDPITSNIAEATDTITFQHGTNSVQVVKTPNGNQVPPGPSFTYTLTSTNNGVVDITNPVITDYLPVDAEGPMVVLADPPNFTYSIAGGTGMPTNPLLVTETDDSADPTNPTLTFTFPPGSTLPVGATYTIEYDVVLRAGLPAGTEFTNEFGIVGDRPWDQCDGDPSDEIDPATGECLAEATNSVQLAGAMSVRKLVQAEGSDQLGLTTDPAVATAEPADCEADLAGFYARPCIPIAEPGGDITFRMHFINSGNRGIDRVLGIDSLPEPGDTLATVPAIQRGSEWLPTFAGERPALAPLSAGIGTLNVWIVTGESTCDAVAPTVADDTAAPPNLLCPDLDWIAWPAGQTLADLGITPEMVSGLQVEILPTEPLGPADTVDVDFHMTAPPFLPDADYTAPQAQPDEITYNTVGTTGRIVDAGGAPVNYTLPSEPPRVGVALANGPLRIVKIVTGDAARWAADSFPVTLSCVSAGEDVVFTPDVANRTLVPNEPQVINNLPWNAECTLTETGNQGQTSTTSTTATVQRDGQIIATATITNVYDDAPLTIAKVVDSDAVDENGEPIPYGPFVVTVRCTFLGSQVFADGYGPGEPMDFVLEDGDTITLTGIPVGALCVVNETDDKGASTTTIDVVAAEEETTTDGTRVSQRLPEGDVSATITNSYTVGAVSIAKVVNGVPSAYDSSETFVVAVTCTLDDESGSRVVYDDEVVLGGDQPLTATIDNLPAGAECLFEETDTAGAASASIEPADGVTVGDGTEATLTVTNEFPTGSVTINKVITGDPGAPGAAGPFTVAVTCTLDDGPGTTSTVHNANVVLGGSQTLTATIDDLPTGALCEFDETDSRGASSEIDPADSVVVGDGTVTTVTVTNNFIPPPLPATGGNVERLLRLAAGSMMLGIAALGLARLRRRRGAELT